MSFYNLNLLIINMKMKSPQSMVYVTLSFLLFFLIIFITFSPLQSLAQNNATTTTTTTTLLPGIKYANQSLVFDAKSKPYGLAFGEWTGKWWQWAYSIQKNKNPAYDNAGKYCAEGQSGPVWFLTSSYQHPVDRYCTIPFGKSILFTILNSECSFAEFPNLKTEKQLRQCAQDMQNSVIHVQAKVDGNNITDLGKYRIQSPLFNFTIPKNNILDLPSQITTSSVSDGNWVFLKPLVVGKHIISFKGSLKNVSKNKGDKSNEFSFAGPYGWDNKVTYHITIPNKNNTSSSSNQSLVQK
jgi:hypothetical protein